MGNCLCKPGFWKIRRIQTQDSIVPRFGGFKTFFWLTIIRIIVTITYIILYIVGVYSTIKIAYTFLTLWSFTLLLISLIFSSILSFIFLLKLKKSENPQELLHPKVKEEANIWYKLGLIIFQMAFTNAWLVMTFFWAFLRDGKGWFTRFLHGGNIVPITLDLFFNQSTFPKPHLLFSIIFNLIYLVDFYIYYSQTHIWRYSVLDLSQKHGIGYIFHILAIICIILFFAFGALLAWIRDKKFYSKVLIDDQKGSLFSKLNENNSNDSNDERNNNENDSIDDDEKNKGIEFGILTGNDD
ncbi:hypothetical protein M0811_04930 [Anaeramoeba ignava]|uniref:Uncharacterized protein n=1 Tax=Anaeramoeba ignava TaxID=1746090 RepID=A0A9Q0LWI3_ANAIG|nr:hypothetical protein M0811_04930 [Anaeramoeba ignava]